MEFLKGFVVDTAIHSVHSTRHASASKNFVKGLSIEKISSKVDWKNEFSFLKHNLPIVQDDTPELSAEANSV